ncbi:hypothetical protein B0H63DRAFT_456499 [Podospora didyma]|uniref:WD repeat-containing protein n=1 Tax=Podospora didyma TaxID=330526 RepID=A0AAE0P4A2_9PEZI|nr:hypothetical protein B0H63DRAFT_456499 [Podospora didyma]
MYNIGNQGKIMRKLLGKPTLESSHDASHNSGVTSSPLVSVYRPSASQDAVHNAGVPIGSLDISPDGHSAILAGRHVLKTIALDGLSIRDTLDVRALLSAQPAPKKTSASSVHDQLSIKDVKWGGWQATSTIYTACANGQIFQYDLSRAGSNAAGGSGIEFLQIREDTRQINALDINPHRGNYVLSGSQDGIVRCLDIRVPNMARAGPAFRALHAFKCNADGVRQVKWSPKDGFYFACGTEQGVVLKWDIRKSSAPVFRINAHEKLCTSIAWHPDGDHLVSAGWDSKCHVWDMSKTADKRQKPKWTISAPAPVAAIAWRPGQWSATAQGKRASQLAVSYDESSQKRYDINAVHIWDLARPTMPYREIQKFESSPSAILWRDQYLLWTVGRDGLFNQCDVTFANKVLDRQPVSTMSFSSRGEVLMFLDERTSSHRPRHSILHADSVPLPSYSSTPSTPRFSVSRSDSEDDVIGSFLGPKRRTSQKRRLSTRSALALSTTPPTGPGMEEVMSLEQTIKVTGIFKPQQAMAIGHVPAAARVDVYGYLSTNYLEILSRELPFSSGETSLPERVATILEHYAKAAEHVSQFRLAQTWRILAYAMDLLIKRRGQYHLECRMDYLKKSLDAKRKGKASGLAPEMSVDGRTDGEETPRKVLSVDNLDRMAHPRSLLSELDSTSNVPTPLARPVPDDYHEGTAIHDSGRGKKLTPIIEPDSFSLPPSIQSHSLEARRRLDSVPLSITSQDSAATYASTEGYDFYDAEALSKAINVPFHRQSSPHHTPNFHQPARRQVMRHDSDDSFSRVFSTSEGSRQAAAGMASSSDGSMLTEIRDASGSDDGEFGSRIRGQHMEESPDRLGRALFRRPLERSETGLTAFTDEHHLITQTTTDSLESRYPSQTDTNLSVQSQDSRSPRDVPNIIEDDDSSPYIIETDYLCWANDPPYPHPVLPSPLFSATRAPPLQPYNLISRALAFEAKSSALNASAIVLLFKPLIPEDIIDSFQSAAILRQHHSRLMSMKLFVEAALLRKLCMKGWPGGPLSGWGDNYPSIFTPAQQGVQVGYFCSSCRKPREVDHTSRSSESVWRCERCRAVMAPCAVCGHRNTAPTLPPAPLKTGLSGGSGSAYENEPVMSTWWYCSGCGHGGHSSCLQGWHASFEAEQLQHVDAPRDPADAIDSSDGYCPLDGCGHECLPSRWRADASDAAARMEEVGRAVREAARVGAAVARSALGPERILSALGPDRRGSYAAVVSGNTSNSNSSSREHSIRSDGHEVGPSRAVEGVKEALGVMEHGSLYRGGQAGGGAGTHIPGGGGSSRHNGAVGASILSSSPGRTGERLGERERRKSVKFMPTEDKR